MRKFCEFRDLENLLSHDKLKFLEKIIEIINEEDSQVVIEKLRLSGICFNVYGSQSEKKIFKKIISYINSERNELIPEVNKLINDVNAFGKLFQDFDKRRNNTGVNNIDRNKQIPAYLVSYEILLSSFFDYTQGVDCQSLFDKYPFIIVFGSENGTLVPPEKVISDSIHMIDYILEQGSKVLKYFMYKKVPFSGSDLIIAKEDLQISRQHFDLLSRYDGLLTTYDQWRFWDGNFTKNDNVFDFSFDDEEVLIFQSVATFRKRLLRTKWMNDFKIYADELTINPNTTTLPPEKYRTEDEYLSVIFCKDLFSSADLSEQILNIKLSEWIRAYTILGEISKNFILSRKNDETITLRDWCLVKSESEWIDVFTSNGYDEQKAKVIITNLTFSKRSKDLLDCPFININGNLVVIPTLVKFIAPADVILSNFHTNNLLPNFIGKGFESEVIRMLAESQITGVNIKTIENNQEYECDVVFEIDKDIFFIECKTFHQPDTPRGYYELLEKINDATKQLNRIASFYESNLYLIKEKLMLGDSWTHNNIYKIIVCKTLMGAPLMINECHITDFSNLNRFFNRSEPGLSLGKLLIAPKDKNYDGKITSKKLMNIVVDPPPIKAASIFLRRFITDIQFETTYLRYPGYDGLEMAIPNEETLQKVAKELNIPLEELIERSKFGKSVRTKPNK